MTNSPARFAEHLEVNWGDWPSLNEFDLAQQLTKLESSLDDLEVHVRSGNFDILSDFWKRAITSDVEILERVLPTLQQHVKGIALKAIWKEESRLGELRKVGDELFKLVSFAKQVHERGPFLPWKKEQNLLDSQTMRWLQECSGAIQDLFQSIHKDLRKDHELNYKGHDGKIPWNLRSIKGLDKHIIAALASLRGHNKEVSGYTHILFRLLEDGKLNEFRNKLFEAIKIVKAEFDNIALVNKNMVIIVGRTVNLAEHAIEVVRRTRIAKKFPEYEGRLGALEGVITKLRDDFGDRIADSERLLQEEGKYERFIASKNRLIMALTERDYKMHMFDEAEIGRLELVQRERRNIQLVVDSEGHNGSMLQEEFVLSDNWLYTYVRGLLEAKGFQVQSDEIRRFIETFVKYPGRVRAIERYDPSTYGIIQEHGNAVVSELLFLFETWGYSSNEIRNRIRIEQKLFYARLDAVDAEEKLERTGAPVF